MKKSWLNDHGVILTQCWDNILQWEKVAGENSTNINLKNEMNKAEMD